MATVVAFIFLSAALLLTNRSLLLTVLASEAIGVAQKLAFIVSLYGTIVTNFTLLSASYLVLVSILFGVNIALLVFYIRRRRTTQGDTRMKVANIGGLISAVFGLGCMACGSVVLSALIGVTGATAVIASMPFHGFEFGVIGVVLLLISIRYMLKRVGDPLTCTVD
jgi:hypothetical protein